MVCTVKSEEVKEGTRGGEMKGNWEKKQMERQTESGKEREEKKTGTGRHVPNNICEGGRKRRGSSGCVWEKAFQTTSVMRATSVMRGREER